MSHVCTGFCFRFNELHQFFIYPLGVGEVKFKWRGVFLYRENPNVPDIYKILKMRYLLCRSLCICGGRYAVSYIWGSGSGGVRKYRFYKLCYATISNERSERVKIFLALSVSFRHAVMPSCVRCKPLIRKRLVVSKNPLFILIPVLLSYGVMRSADWYRPPHCDRVVALFPNNRCRKVLLWLSHSQ